MTGAAGGIGRATADLLAERGASLALLDRDADAVKVLAERFDEAGTPVCGLVADVGVEEQVRAAVRSAFDRFGRIDVLVNNAGHSAPAAPLWEIHPAVFESVLRVHLTGTYLLCREVIPHMLRAGYGRVVNVASVAGKEGNAGSGPYSAAKAGMIGLTKSLGKELATSGVLVNAVTPTIVETPLVAAAEPEHIAGLVAKIPMGRVGRPAEIAELIAWLSSPRCSFSTAAVFDASGGRSTY
ncbi:SDR family NAD(P)-dependent oxidoreductase [Pseudonocardia sp. KRD291]|uniref:SDR family oxidoreductase n=1 Tax=Pseudonocardia sp. KRD291 TaxID=2792007 RepID=UPI0027E29C51|nr:SDR family NAD(P)-dependent oxidoreductase [Pseudonocardia sp. KRD291]